MRIFTFLLFLLPFAVDAQIWSEDFDGGNTTNPPMWSSVDLPCGDNNDYVAIVCSPATGCAIPVMPGTGTGMEYFGSTGQFFGARDMDSTPCGNDVTLNEALSFTGIDISSSPAPTVLYLCFDVAESRNNDPNGDGDFSDGAEWGSSNLREDTWDGDSYLNVNASVDGAPISQVTAISNFTENGSSSDKRPGIDVNCNGQSNDAGEPELTDTFTTYCFELPTSGALLDLNFEVGGLNGGGEDIAIDNIEVYSASTPANGTLLDACTPFVPGNPNCNDVTLWLENFDGSNTTNPPVLPTCDATPSRDYLGIVCNNGDGCPNEINSDYLYFGASGQYFGVRDMDNVCNGSQDETLSFTGIDISGCAGPANNLYLCFDMAESQPNNGREMTGNPPIEDSWDGNSNINFMVSFDGCPFEEVTALESSNGTNSRPGIDTNCGGGSAGVDHLLSDQFQTFCFLLTQEGSLLDLNIQVIGLNTDGEDVAIDNIAVICSDNTTCLPSTPIVACAVAEPLAITCPADNLNLPAGCFPTLPAPDPSLVVVEGCGITATVSHVSDVATDDGCTRTVTRTYSAIGENGDMAECEQVFTFSIDADPPVLSDMPVDVVVACDAIPPVPTITATDACTTTGNPMVSFTEENNSTPCEGGTITRTWTAAADACGNTAAPYVQTITVNPSPAPTITCPADQVVTCFEDIVVDPSMATTTEGCGTIVAVYVKQPLITGGIPGCDGTVYTYIYKAVDECGNVARCEQQFIIQNSAPAITVPAGGTVNCFEDIEVSTSDATVTADCAGDNTINVLGPVVSGPANCPGSTYTYTYRVKDACNRIVEAERVFTIGNNSGPIITAIPLNFNSECEVGPSLDQFLAESGCGEEVELTVSDPTVIGTPGCSGSRVQYTYTATDACGRMASHTQIITIQNDGPVINCPETLQIFNCEDGDKNARIEAWIASVTATSACGGSLDVRDNYNGNAGMCINNGFTNVTFFATDQCGRTTSCVGTLIIMDTEAPIIYQAPTDVLVPCNGVTQDRFNEWLANQGGAEAIDGCWGDNISWSTNPSNPQLNCNGGPQAIVVEFIARDGCGNTASVTGIFNTKVQPDFVNVSGQIMREDAEPVADVQMEITGSSAGIPTMDYTTTNGSYGIPEVEYEDNLDLVPAKNNDPLNGLTTHDLILLQQHILGNNVLDSPYKVIAGDINRSGHISTFDMIHLRRMILFVDDNFQNNNSWRFVEAAYVFPNEANPFEVAFPEVYSLNGETEEAANFIAVKIGDLNLSAKANELMEEAEDRTTWETLSFKVEDQSLAAGTTHRIDFTAENFEQINGFQFTLNLDQAVDLVEVKTADLASFNEQNYGLAKLENGAITVSWNESSLVNLRPDAIVFSLVLEAKQDVQLSEVVSISSEYTKAEAYQSDEYLNVELLFGQDDQSIATNAFKLFQNQPNPFKESTMIGFNLPESGMVNLEVYDVSGRLIYSRKGEFTEGYNQIDLSRSDLPSGILYYHLSTATNSASMKMISLD